MTDSAASFHFSLTDPDAPPIPRPMTKALRRMLADDARWFAQRPGRNVRLRKPSKGEVEAMGNGLPLVPSHEGYPLRIAVLQVRPGVRTRRAVYTTLSNGDPEELILAFIGLVDDGARQGYSGEIGIRDLRLALGLDAGVVH